MFVLDLVGRHLDVSIAELVARGSRANHGTRF